MQIFAHLGKKLPIALPLLMVGALFIAGCGSSAAATPTATPVPPTATPMPTATPVLNSTFSSSDGVYTFQFPGNWTQNPINASPIVNGVTLASPDGNDLFFVTPFNIGIPAAQNSTFIQQTLVALGGKNIKLSAGGTAPLGSNTWTVEQGTVTLKGTAYDAAQFSLTHGGKAFFIIVLAPHTTSDADGTTYFQPMITSLTFLK